jgi:hypothetical protein
VTKEKGNTNTDLRAPIFETFTDKRAAIKRAEDAYYHGHDRTVVVIESFREPGKWFVENDAPLVRHFERVIWQKGKEVRHD